MFDALKILFIFFSLPLWANLEGDEWVYHHKNLEIRLKRQDHKRGVPFVSLAELAKKSDLKFQQEGRLFTLTLKKKRIYLSPSMNLVRGPWGQSRLSEKPVKRGSDLHAPIDIADRVLTPLFSGKKPVFSGELSKASKKVDVFIDPGHGGNDWGTQATKDGVRYLEKNLNLQWALSLERALKKKGISSELSRRRDYFLTLPERGQLANEHNARVFVSLHWNSAGAQSEAQGYEIYLLSLKGDESDARIEIAQEHEMLPQELRNEYLQTLGAMAAEAKLESSVFFAKPVMSALDKTLSPFGKPFKMGPFYLLYAAQMPAMLIEMGFMSSKSDLKLALNPKMRAKLSADIASSLAAGLNKGVVGR